MLKISSRTSPRASFTETTSAHRKKRFGAILPKVRALALSVSISVLRTLRARGQQPLDTILAALASYAATGIMTPMPQAAE
jgi:hypothetical protein